MGVGTPCVRDGVGPAPDELAEQRGLIALFTDLAHPRAHTRFSHCSRWYFCMPTGKHRQVKNPCDTVGDSEQHTRHVWWLYGRSDGGGAWCVCACVRRVVVCVQVGLGAATQPPSLVLLHTITRRFYPPCDRPFSPTRCLLPLCPTSTSYFRSVSAARQTRGEVTFPRADALKPLLQTGAALVSGDFGL